MFNAMNINEVERFGDALRVKGRAYFFRILLLFACIEKKIIVIFNIPVNI